MKNLVSLGLSGLLWFASPSMIFAQTTNPSVEQVDLDNLQISPDKLALIQELRTLMNSDQNYQISLEQIKQQTQQMIAQYLTASFSETSLNAEQKQAIQESINRTTNRLYQLMDSEINLAKVFKNIEIYLYNKYYSEEDLQNLITFYQTETGQKLIKLSPQIQVESMQLFNQNVMPKMIEIQQQVISEEMENLQEQLGK